ncbi:MAG: hypothetical protein JWN00_5069 [Actinomycetia bacterium]|jgi:hypothetical protein|nr:hypothetical protein [Actinomycetes bacterium]
MERTYESLFIEEPLGSMAGAADPDMGEYARVQETLR